MQFSEAFSSFITASIWSGIGVYWGLGILGKYMEPDKAEELNRLRVRISIFCGVMGGTISAIMDLF